MSPASDLKKQNRPISVSLSYIVFYIVIYLRALSSVRFGVTAVSGIPGGRKWGLCIIFSKENVDATWEEREARWAASSSSSLCIVFVQFCVSVCAYMCIYTSVRVDDRGRHQVSALGAFHHII